MCLSEGIEEVEDTSDDDDGESEPRSTTVGNSIPSVPAQMEYYVHRLMVLMWFASASVCFCIGLMRYFVASSFYGSNYGTYVPAKFICPTNSTTTPDGNTNYKESFIDFPQSLAIFVHEALLLPTVATLGFIPLAIAGMSRVMTLVCNAILHIFFLQLQRFGPPLSPEKAVLNAPSWTEIKLVTRRILAHVFTGYDVGKPIAFSRNLLETLGTTTVVGALDATGVLTDMIPVPQKVLFINENPYGDGIHGSDSNDDDDSDDSSSSTSSTDSSSCDDSFSSSSSSTTSKTASLASTVSVHDGDSDTSSQKARRRRRAKRQKYRERRRRTEEKERRRREKLGNFMTPQARKAAKAKERALKVQVKRKKFQEQRFTTLSTYLSGKDDLVVAFEDKEVEQHKTSVNALGLCCLIHALHTNVRDTQTYTASLRHVDRTNFWAKCLHWLPRALNFKDSDAAHYQVVRRVHMIESSKKGSGAYPSQLTGLLALDCHVPDAPLHLFVIGSTQMVVHACDTYWTGTRIEEFDDYEKEEVVYVASKQFQELQGMEAVSCAHRILPVRYKKHLLSGVTVTPSLYGTGSTVSPVEHFFIDGKEISESSAEEIRAGRNQGQGRQRRSHSVPIPTSINRAFPTKRIVRSLSCGECPRNTEGQYQKDESVNVRNMIGLMMSTGHSFLGLVGLQDNVRPHVESAVNILNDAGIRFMYFGAGSENTTKAHGKRFGLETGWNSCISLKAESVALDPQSIRAQLPFGVRLIRQHIVHVDPIPLQVSLFSHCRGHSTRSMVSVLQDNHEVCTILGCSLSHCNALSFVQADVAVSATATPLGSPALAKARYQLPQDLTHTAVTSTNVDDALVSAPLNTGAAIYESRESWYLNTFARVWGGEARPVAGGGSGGSGGGQHHTSSGGSSVVHQPASSDAPSSPQQPPVSPTTDPSDRSWVHTGNLANAAPSTTRSLRNVSDVLSAMCSLKLNDSINSLPIITVLIRESRNMLRSLSSILDFIAGASVAVALLQVLTIVSGLPLLLTEGTTSFFLFVLIPIHALSTTFDTGSWDCMTAVIAKHSFRTRTAIIRHKALIFSLRYPITILFILLCGAISVSSVMSEGAKRSDPTDAYIHITKTTIVREPIISTTDENYNEDNIIPTGSCVVVDDYSGYGSVGDSAASTATSTPLNGSVSADGTTTQQFISPYAASASDTSSNPFWSPRVLLLPQVDLVPVRVFTAILLNVMLSIHALTYVTRHRYLTLRWRFRNAAERKQSVTIAKCKRWLTITVFANVLGFVFQQCSLWTASWDETELLSLLVSGTYRELTSHQQKVYGNVFMCIPAGVPAWCIVIGFLVLPVVMLLLDYPLKRWRHRRYIEVQKYRRLAFGTRLGMHSPQGDYEPDNNANAAATTEQALMDELSAEAAAEEEAAAAAAGGGDKVPLRRIDNTNPHFSDTTNVSIYDNNSNDGEELQGGSESQSGGWSDSPSSPAVGGGSEGASHHRRHHHHHHHHYRSSDGGPDNDMAAASSTTTAPSSPTSPLSPPATAEMSHGDGSEELWAHESGLLPRRVLRFLYRFLSVEEGRMESSCVCCDHPDGGGARAKYQLMNLQ